MVLPQPDHTQAPALQGPPAHVQAQPFYRTPPPTHAGPGAPPQVQAAAAAGDEDWLLALEQREAFAPSSAAATVSTHRAALAREDSPGPVLHPPVHPAPTHQPAADHSQTAAAQLDAQGQGQELERVSSSTSGSSSSSSGESDKEEGEVVEHRRRSRSRGKERRHHSKHKHSSSNGHHERHVRHSRHRSRSRSRSRSRRASDSRERTKTSQSKSRSSKDRKSSKRSRSGHSRSPQPGKAARKEQGPTHVQRAAASSVKPRHSPAPADTSGTPSDASGDLRARLRAMLSRVA
jgi:hypothetical protein